MDRPDGMTLWRCRCGHAERAEEAPLHCGEPMRALAQEMKPDPAKRRGRCPTPCFGKRRPL